MSTTSHQPVISLKKAYELAFSPAGDQVVYIGGRDVTLLDARTGKPQFAVHPIANPSHLDISPDGSWLAVKGTSGRIVLLDAKKGDLLSDFKNQQEGEGDEALFSACGSYVATVSWKGLFNIRKWTTKEEVFSRLHVDGQLTRLSATADRSLLAYSIGRKPRARMGLTPCTVMLQQWSDPYDKAAELPQEWPAIWGLKISPSGRFLALVYGTPPNILEVYDISKKRTVGRSKWSGSPGCSIAWSSDEKTLVTNGDDTFRMYAVPKLDIMRELPVEYPCFAVFSPDQDQLALGSWKKSFVVPVGKLDEFAIRRIGKRPIRQ